MEGGARRRHRDALGDLPGRRCGGEALLPGLRDRRGRRDRLVRGRYGTALAGELPSAAESAQFKARLEAARGLPAPVADLLQSLPRDSHPLDALRTAVSLAATRDPDVRASDPEANLRKAFRLMTLVPETVAAWQRIRTGRAPVATPAAVSHAAYFLELLDGQAPSREVARVLDVV